MSAFKGLYWKEMKITRNDFYMLLGIMFFVYIIGFGLTNYFHEQNIIAVISFIIFFMHTFYLPIMIITSLRIEGKTQLWLHNPKSGSMLFLAKMFSGLTYYCVSFLLSAFITYWMISKVDVGQFQFIQDHLAIGLFYVGITILLTAIYFSIWVMFYWTLYHSLKKISFVKNIRWLIIIGTWILFHIIGTYIMTTPIFEKITQFGMIEINILEGISFEVSQTSANVIPNLGIFHFSIVEGLLYTLLTLAVFFISVWLLERKVEV